MAVTGPITGFSVVDPNTGNPQDLGNRYVSKDYLLDVYPNLVPGRTSPGLWGWGDNNRGALGLGDTNTISSPVQVGSLTNWKQISVGFQQSSFAIKTDGTLWSWGDNQNIQLGQNNFTSYSSPVQVGSLNNWKQVSSGYYACLAIKTDGTLWAWGDNAGDLGLGDTLDRNSPVQVGSLTNWKQVSSSYYFTSAIKTDGTLWTWGENSYGQLGLGDTTSRSSPVQVGSLYDWKIVATGESHTIAIKTDGTLWTFGNQINAGQLGLGDTTSRSSPVQVGSLTNWKNVSGGRFHTVAIKTDGTLWAWGLGINGQLGLNERFSRSSPVQVGSLTNWKQTTCGLFHTLAIKTDGTLWAWGGSDSNRGQLGLGDSIGTSSPVQVGSLTTWKQVETGGGLGPGSGYTLAIQDGYL
jgi:alpha-tubulin suppressor-like RCC1 family protein